MASSADGGEASAAAAPLLDEAEAALAAGRPQLCLTLLRATETPSAVPEQRRRLQLHAVCRIQLACQGTSTSAWWQLLDLDPGRASAAGVKRQVKRLGAGVHPDKCALPGAGAAFQELQRASVALLRDLEIGRKRARSGSDQDASDAGEDWEGAKGDGGGFPWWGDWDPPGKKTTEAGTGGAAPRGGRAGTRDTASSDTAVLQEMETGALREEVRRRQDAMLAPPVPGVEGAEAEAPASPRSLRAALLRARSALSMQLQAERETAAAAGGGGFLP